MNASMRLGLDSPDTYELRRKSSSCNDNDINGAFISTCLSILVLGTWLIIFGIFLFNGKSQCQDPILLATSAGFFWSLLGVLSFVILSTFLAAVITSKNSGKCLFTMNMVNVFVIYGTLLITTVIGWVFVLKSVNAEGCTGLYYSLWTYVIFYTSLLSLCALVAMMKQMEDKTLLNPANYVNEGLVEERTSQPASQPFQAGLP
jgi:hypothetical protein